MGLKSTYQEQSRAENLEESKRDTEQFCILLTTIREQEEQITSLKRQVDLLQKNSEKLLEQESLQKENKILKFKLKEAEDKLNRKTAESKKFESMIEECQGRFGQLSKLLPSEDTVRSYTKVMTEAEKRATSICFFEYINTAIAIVFIVLVTATGSILYYTKDSIDTIEVQATKAVNGLYNDKGWSVLEGTANNEWVFSQKNPKAYQNYLNSKK